MACIPALAMTFVLHIHAVTTTEDSTFPPTSLTAPVGQRAVIRCRTTVEGNVQWVYFNDSLTSHEQIVASEGRVMPELAEYYSLNSSGTRDHALIVKKSKLEDTGLYSCIEKSGLGDRHKSCLCITGKDDAMIHTNSCDGWCSGNVTIYAVVPLVIVLVIAIVIALWIYWKRRKTVENEVDETTSFIAEDLPTGRSRTQTVRSIRTSTTDSGVDLRYAEKRQVFLHIGNGQKENTAEVGHLGTKFCRTIVADADNNESCSRVFTIVGDNLYLVNATQKKIQVYSIAENSVGERMKDCDIDLSKLELKKPCCFTASLDGDHVYLGDRESRAIFKFLLEKKTSERWVEVDRGEVQSLSPLKDGLVVLIIDKDIEDKFWHGRVFIYNSDGKFRTRINVPAQYFLPYCIKAIDDDLFAISYGVLNASGLAIFSEQDSCVSLVTSNKNLCIPGNFCYDKDERRFVIADAGTKKVLAVERNADGRMGDPKVLYSWATVGEFDYSVDAVRPVRVTYVSSTEPKRVIIALRNGRIDLHHLID